MVMAVHDIDCKCWSCASVTPTASGQCKECGRAIDDHKVVGVDAPMCPR